MPADRPEKVHQLFAEYFSARDLGGLVSLYEPDATLMPQPGQCVNGTKAIGEALNGFLSLNGQFKFEYIKAIAAQDIAIVLAKWSLTGGKDPEGNEVFLSGTTSDVVRRQSNGTWLLVIDNPFGAEGVTA